MAARPRDSGAPLCVLTAAAAVAGVCLLALRQPGWPDYGAEARPAVEALVAGHMSKFLTLAPSYGGSLLLRAPVLLLTHAAGGDGDWLYRSSALMCLLAAVGLGLWLAARLRSRGKAPLVQALAVAVCAANPMAVEAIRWGHPEEILGGVLCVSAVLAALGHRPGLAGLLLGLAIANKDWALVAVGPVLAALCSHRVRAAISAATAAAIMLAPFAWAGGAAAHAGAAASTGTTFQRWQAWWFFGSPGGDLAAHPLAIGYRTAPPWLSTVAHPLIVLLAFGLSAAFILVRAHGSDGQRRGPARQADALLLLALVLLMRCVLDPWDISYYTLPFLLALGAWEAHGASRLPVAALAASACAWFAFQEMPRPGFGLSTDEQAAIFIGLSAVAGGALAIRLYSPAIGARRGSREPAGMAASLTPG